VANQFYSAATVKWLWVTQRIQYFRNFQIFFNYSYPFSNMCW